MKKILFLLCLIPALSYAQNNSKKGSGVLYTSGVPTVSVDNNFDSELAIDTTTGYWYEHSRDGLGWLQAGFRIQKFNSSSAPTFTPADKQSEVVLNNVDSLYRYRSGVWRHLNKSRVYLGGNGITVIGNLIAAKDTSPTNEIETYTNTGTSSYVNTLSSGSTFTIRAGGNVQIAHASGSVLVYGNADPDSSKINEGINGVAAGGATNAQITSNTTGANPVVIQAGTAINVSETTGSNGGTITISNGGDLSNTNEIQTLSLAGNDLTILGGNTVTLPSSGGGAALPAQQIGYGNTSSIVSDAAFTRLLNTVSIGVSDTTGRLNFNRPVDTKYAILFSGNGSTAADRFLKIKKDPILGESIISDWNLYRISIPNHDGGGNNQIIGWGFNHDEGGLVDNTKAGFSVSMENNYSNDGAGTDHPYVFEMQVGQTTFPDGTYRRPISIIAGNTSADRRGSVLFTGDYFAYKSYRTDAQKMVVSIDGPGGYGGYQAGINFQDTLRLNIERNNYSGLRQQRLPGASNLQNLAMYDASGILRLGAQVDGDAAPTQIGNNFSYGRTGEIDQIFPALGDGATNLAFGKTGFRFRDYTFNSNSELSNIYQNNWGKWAMAMPADSGLYFYNYLTAGKTLSLAGRAPALSINVTAKGNVGLGTNADVAKLTLQGASTLTPMIRLNNSPGFNDIFHISYNPNTNLPGYPGDVALSMTGKLYLKESGFNTNTGWSELLTSETYTGTVTNFSAGDLSPLFTTSETNTTTTPALAFNMNTQTANKVFASDPAGTTTTPTFRALVPLDIPALDFSKITTGVVPVTQGGTGLNTFGTPLQYLRVNSGGTALEYGNLPAGLTGSGTGNYMPKWTTTTSLGDSPVFVNPSTNNIGINTTSPQVKLQIVDATTAGTFTGNNAQGMRIGSGTNNSYSFLQWGETFPIAQIGMYRDNSVGTRLDFGTSNNFGTGVTNTALSINETGLVGLSTTNPGRTLDVNGEVRIRDRTTTTATGIIGSDANGVLSDVTLSGLTIPGGVLTAADGANTNEGSLTVGAGTGTTSLINSNTSGSTPVTLSATGIITLAESSNTIVIGATEIDGSQSNEGFLSLDPAASNTSIIRSNTSGSPDITLQYGGILTGSESGNTLTLTATEVPQVLSTGTNTISLSLGGGGPLTVDTDPSTDVTSAAGAATGYIAYFDGTRTVTGVSDWYRDVINSRVGLGVSTSPLAKMHIAGTGTSSSTHNFRTTNSSGVVGINSRDDGAVSIGSSVPQTGFTLTTVGPAYFSSDAQVAGLAAGKTANTLWGRDATGFLVPVTFNPAHITLTSNVLDVTGVNPTVSAGNNTYIKATGVTDYRVDSDLGAVAWKGDTTLAGVSFTLNDWTPPGWGNTTSGVNAKTIVGVTMTGNQLLTGVSNGIDGRWLVIYNLDSNDKLTIDNQSTSSTVGNRFFLAADFDILPGQIQKFIYSSVKGGWVLDGHQNTDTEFFTTSVTTTTFDINDASGKTTDVDGVTIPASYVAFVGNLAAYTLTKNNTPLARSGTVTRDYSFNPSTGVVTLTATPVTGDKFVLTMRP